MNGAERARARALEEATAALNEAAAAGEANRDEANRDEANRDEANRGEANRGEANRDEANRDEIDRDEIDRDEIDRAVAVLRRGGLVAFPTETVYGLGADAGNPQAVARLFCVKGRPAEHPLIVHLGDPGGLDGWAAEIPEEARRLAGAFWPGPLTLVLRRGPRTVPEVTGGRPTVGLRVPAQPLALALLRAFGGGIAAPSANRFGRVSPTSAAHVRADLGEEVDVVLDGGTCRVGVESTILDLSEVGSTADPSWEPTVLRHGGVPAEAIEGILGRPVRREAAGPARAPGMLPAHYAPAARVEIAADLGDAAARARGLAAEGARVGVLAADPGVLPEGVLPEGVVALAVPGGPEGYARLLYARLREADARGLDVVIAVPPPPEGLGAAVADRLRRAAAASRRS